MADQSPDSERGRIIVIVPSPTDDGSIDAGKFFDALWQAKLRIILCVAVFGGAFATYAVLSERVYVAHAVVAPADDASESVRSLLSGQLGALASFAGLGSGALTGKRAEYVALLTSNSLLYRFVEERNLLPVLFKDIWNEAEQQWEPRWLAQEPRIGDGVQRLLGRVLTVDVTKEGLITLSVEWSDPQLAAEWANALIAEVNRFVRARTITDAKRGMEFLNRELKLDPAIQVQAGLYRLQEANLSKIMLANVQEDYALRVVDAAVVPLRPIKPRWLLLTLLGVLLGGAFGGAWALWRKHAEWWHPGPVIPKITSL